MKNRFNPHLLALLVIAACALVRGWIIFGGQLDLIQDEAQYWDWSRHLQLSYYSKGPLISWIIAFFTGLGGNTEAAVRMGALLGAFFAQIFLYLAMARYMRKPWAGVLLLLIANSTPLFMAGGLLMTTDNPLLLAWAGALCCLLGLQAGNGQAEEYQAGERLCAQNSPPQSQAPQNMFSQSLFQGHQAGPGKTETVLLWLGLGFFTAFGVLAKYTMLLLPALAVAHAILLLSRRAARPGYVPRLAVTLACGVAAGLLPIVIWNWQNDWVSFRHVATLAGVAGASNSFISGFKPLRWLEFAGSQLGLLLPWWFVFMLVGAASALRKAWQGWRGQCGKLTPGPEAARVWLLLLTFWPLFAYFTLWALFKRVYPNWAAMCYVSGLIFAALAVARLFDRHTAPEKGRVPHSLDENSSRQPEGKTQRGAERGAERAWGRRLLPVWAGLSLFIFCAVYGQDLWTRVIPLPEKLNPAVRLKGWSDLGGRLEELRLSMPNPDKVFFFSDAYDVTAELAFYAPGQPVAYCADFGRRSSQYDLWPGPEDKVGWDAVYVARKPEYARPDMLEKMFEEVGGLEVYASRHRGVEGRVFGIIRLRNFNGFWPETAEKSY